MKSVLAIAIGGAFGALSRYWFGSSIQRHILDSPFPWGTFAVNIIGAFALGLTLTALPNRPIWLAALGTGFLGSFTTFSTFSYETVGLFRDGFETTAVMYIIVSFAAAIIGVLAGMWIGTHLQVLPATEGAADLPRRGD